MYWCESPKPVFYNKTLIEGLLEYIEIKDQTNGFTRILLSNKLT